jgi:hypothetical protein
MTLPSWKRIPLFVAVLFTLGGLGALGAATLGGEEAAAGPCCSVCDESYDRCMARCTGDDCDLTCFERQLPCYNTCYWLC